MTRESSQNVTAANFTKQLSCPQRIFIQIATENALRQTELIALPLAAHVRAG